jgi:hypothetical protein
MNMKLSKRTRLELLVIFLFFLILIFTFGLSSCRSKSSPISTFNGNGVSYIHDSVHGVGIWVYDASYGCAISVIPDSQYNSTGVK